MIIAIVGGIGSGKTVSATRNILLRDNNIFANFSIKHPKVTRLKKSHIISEEVIGVKKSGIAIKDRKINWEFWNKNRESGYDICLDEVHNIIHSRMAMSKNNVLLTTWISQIRKILGDNENYHIWLISQRLGRIDVAFRDLLMKIIHCAKFQIDIPMPTYVRYRDKKILKTLPMTIIFQYEFSGVNCVRNYEFWLENPKLAKRRKLYRRSYFVANRYFQYYDSYEIVNFGEDAYL